jgi:hypothetical protein
MKICVIFLDSPGADNVDREGRTAIAYPILDVLLPTTSQSADDLAVGPRWG